MIFNNDNNSDSFLLFIISFIFIILFIIISLPAVILATILIIVFMNVKKIKRINKLYFCIASFVLAFLVNFKSSFIHNYYLTSKDFLGVIVNAIFDNKSSAIPTYYQNYILNINIVWQLLIALILSSIISEIFYLHRKEEKKGKTKTDIKKETKHESKMKKYLEKIDLLPHDEKTTTIGADYENVKTVKINDDAKHIFIAGTTGAGKTVAISNFIESAMQKNNPVFAIDGKGDLGNGSLLDYMQSLSEKNNRKLYVINFVEPTLSDYYNPFKNAGMTEAKDMLIGMTEWSEPHYKINTERYLQLLIKILNIKKIRLDLNTIIKYTPTQFQNLIEEMKNNNELGIDEFTKISDIIEHSADIINSAMARFATTAESEAGEIFTNDGIDIYTAMEEKANILMILDPLGKPEFSKQVGILAMLDAKKAVSKIFKDKKLFPDMDIPRKYFILDEFNVYASDIAINLLNKSRTANVTCIPAVQSLSDLDKAGGKALRNQVIENCNNYLIMRQNSYDSSAEWEKVIGQEEVTNFTYSVEEKKSLFGHSILNTGNASKHTAMESKYTYSDIQNLENSQAILISKDQKIDKKIKVRFVKIDPVEKKEPIKINLDKTVQSKPIDDTNPIEPKEITKTDGNGESNFDDIENMLK